MKVALCLSGIIGGTAGKNGAGDTADYELCYKHFKKFVIAPNNCDAFIHSWSVEHEKALVRTYQPKKCAFETQINFRGIGNIYRFRSKWYSTVKSLELMKSYGEYDWVIISRFDLLLFKTFDLSSFNLDFIYVPIYPIHVEPNTKQLLNGIPPVKHSIGDMFIIASYANILKLVLDDPEDWFYAELINPHKAMYNRVADVFGNPRKIVRMYGRDGKEYALYRHKIH